MADYSNLIDKLRSGQISLQDVQNSYKLNKEQPEQPVINTLPDNGSLIGAQAALNLLQNKQPTINQENNTELGSGAVQGVLASAKTGVQAADKTAPEEDTDKKISSTEETPDTNKLIQQYLDLQKQNEPKADYKDALKNSADAEFNQQLMRIANRAGSHIAMTPIQNEDIYQQNIKSAQEIPDQFLKIKQAEKQDPNSEISKGFQDLLKQYGINNPTLSAADVEKFFPTIYTSAIKSKEFQQKEKRLEENAKNKLEETKQWHKVLEAIQGNKVEERKTVAEEKKDKQNKDRLDKLGKLLTSETASSRSAFGVAARNAQAVENANALLDGVLDYNQIDNRQKFELAKVLDRVLSQGQVTISGSKELNPNTAASYLAKVQEYLTNQPKGAQAGAFIKRMKDTLDREGTIAAKQIKSTQQKILGPYLDLAEKDPEGFSNVIRAQGLDPTLFVKQPKSSQKDDEEHNEALEWAKANPTDPRAKQILEINGIK